MGDVGDMGQDTRHRWKHMVCDSVHACCAFGAWQQSKGYVEGIIGVQSTLGVHWKVMVCVSILTCVLCMAECVMYVGGELG